MDWKGSRRSVGLARKTVNEITGLEVNDMTASVDPRQEQLKNIKLE